VFEKLGIPEPDINLEVSSNTGGAEGKFGLKGAREPDLLP
jgi:hypothetical protein